MDTAKYPEDQSVRKCLPKYGKTYLFFKYEEDFDFSAPITLPRVSCGVNSRRKCTWSISPLISVILTCICSAMLGRTVIRSLRIA